MTTPTKRRPNGLGSITKTASGYTVSLGKTINGKLVRKSKRVKTKSEANKALLDLRLELYDENRQAAEKENPTVYNWCSQWLTTHAQTIAPSTLIGYRAAFDTWYLPLLGDKPLDQLTPADLQIVTSKILVAGKSSTTAGTYQKYFQMALKAATIAGHNIQPGCLILPKPKPAKSRRAAIPLEDMKKLLTAAECSPLYTRWLAALVLGLRQGEARGLTWSQIDFKKRIISIEWQLQDIAYGTVFPPHYEHRQLVGSYYLTRPKSESGIRMIPMPGFVYTAFKTWQQQAAVNPYDLVWSGVAGTPLPKKADVRAWQALQDRAGVRNATGDYYDLHEARHSAATLLLDLGVDAEVVKTILGHSEVAMTRHYQHVSLELAAKAMKRLEKVL